MTTENEDLDYEVEAMRFMQESHLENTKRGPVEFCSANYALSNMQMQSVDMSIGAFLAKEFAEAPLVFHDRLGLEFSDVKSVSSRVMRRIGQVMFAKPIGAIGESTGEMVMVKSKIVRSLKTRTTDAPYHYRQHLAFRCARSVMLLAERNIVDDGGAKKLNLKPFYEAMVKMP
jgi:hypothetical protein